MTSIVPLMQLAVESQETIDVQWGNSSYAHAWHHLWLSSLFHNMKHQTGFLTPHTSICHHALPSLGVQSYCFEIICAYIFEADLGPANWSLARVEFSIEDIFWDLSILHPGEVTKSPQVSLLQHGKHGVDACYLQNSVVCYTVSPCNAKNVPKALYMKGIKLLFLARV